MQFTTGEEREYPQGFCRAYAEAAQSLLRGDNSFIEIFSGPNAPLSQAVCDRFGEALPGSRLNTERGVRSELRRLSQVMVPDLQNQTELIDLPKDGKDVPAQAESSYSRLSMLEAGRQPSYGKRQQLIPDGLNSTLLHLREARELVHPFNETQSLKPDHVSSLRLMERTEARANLSRLRELAEWRQLSRSTDVLSLQVGHEGMASDTSKKLGRKPRTALLETLGRKYGLEDKAVPTLLLTGMPIVGAALESPFFLYPTGYHHKSQSMNSWLQPRSVDLRQ